MSQRLGVYAVLVSAVFMVGGCASTKVERIAVDKKVDMSGRWNDTDARQIADAMIKDCTNQSWSAAFVGGNKRLPVVIVGELRNQSAEHINTEIFTKSIERSLLNSGKAKFVANKIERPQVRAEREQQQSGTTARETIRKMARETGADYMMIGSINSVKDETHGRYVIFYQVSLELIDLETNEKVWIGEDNIKKLVEKNKYSL